MNEIMREIAQSNESRKRNISRVVTTTAGIVVHATVFIFCMKELIESHQSIFYHLSMHSKVHLTLHSLPPLPSPPPSPHEKAPLHSQTDSSNHK